MTKTEVLKGSCHCGKTAFTVQASLPEKLTRCTCSFCSKRGALHAYFEPEQFTLSTPEKDRSVYRWNSKTANHYFCGECGCGTYSDTPAYGRDGSWDGKSRRISVNARLFDNFDAATYPVTVIDGKNLW